MEAAVQDREVSIGGNGRHIDRQPHKHSHVRWGRWIFFSIVVAVVASVAIFRLQPLPVEVARPLEKTVAETISSSGVVQGHTDATVGSQMPGIVTALLVEEGDRVRAGQLIARVQDNVAKQQVEQARAAVDSARAALAQASSGPLFTEIGSAQARARQSRIGIEQARSSVVRAQIGISMAKAGISQADTQLARALAALRQAESRLSLASKNLDRKRMLAQAGAIPTATLDEAQSAYDVAASDRDAAAQTVEAARIGISTARESEAVSRQELQTAQAQVRAAEALAQAAENDVRTLRSQPRDQVVAVAVQRLKEAEAAFTTAKLQAQNSEVVAPFDGTVTEILAHPGAASTGGILKLVGTRRLEVRIDLDEADLAKVRVGQRAVLASGIQEIQGRVARLGSQIDSLRGTLEVYVVADSTPVWMTPGQTLNVNLVVNEHVKRLLVPSRAIQREGDQTIVYTIRDGKAVSTAVRLGPLSDDNVPVLEGLKASDGVIQNAVGLTPDTRVRTKGR
jgi:HlyD family secretion protein